MKYTTTFQKLRRNGLYAISRTQIHELSGTYDNEVDCNAAIAVLESYSAHNPDGTHYAENKLLQEQLAKAQTCITKHEDEIRRLLNKDAVRNAGSGEGIQSLDDMRRKSMRAAHALPKGDTDGWGQNTYMTYDALVIRNGELERRETERTMLGITQTHESLMTAKADLKGMQKRMDNIIADRKDIVIRNGEYARKIADMEASKVDDAHNHLMAIKRLEEEKDNLEKTILRLKQSLDLVIRDSTLDPAMKNSIRIAHALPLGNFEDWAEFTGDSYEAVKAKNVELEARCAKLMEQLGTYVAANSRQAEIIAKNADDANLVLSLRNDLSNARMQLYASEEKEISPEKFERMRAELRNLANDAQRVIDAIEQANLSEQINQQFSSSAVEQLGEQLESATAYLAEISKAGK